MEGRSGKGVHISFGFKQVKLKMSVRPFTCKFEVSNQIESMYERMEQSLFHC